MKIDKTRRTQIVIASCCLLIAGGLTFALTRPAPPPQLLTEVARLGDLEESVLATGSLKASQQVSVGAQVSGQIKALHVQLGDLIKKGQLIAEIDSLTQQNSLKTSEAALQSNVAQKHAKEATLKQAELAFLRQKELLAKDAGSKTDFESAEAALNVARADVAAVEAQIAQARVAVDTARVNVGYTRITAPIDGYIVNVPVKEGQTVNAAQSAPTIVKIAALGTMTVKAEISEADVPRVKPGQSVYFTLLGEPEQRYYSKLRAVEPMPSTSSDDDSSSSSTSTTSTTSSAIYYNGLFDIANPQGKLRISMTVQAHIVLAEAKNVLSIPAAALGEKQADGRYQILVQGPGPMPEKRLVKVGMNNRERAQILEGLQAGERIVLGQAEANATTSTGRMGPPPM